MSVLHKHTERSSHPDRPLPAVLGSVRLQHPLLAAVVALVVGVGATAAGAGIGIRHLQKAGVTIPTVLGLAVLAMGLLLLGRAATVAWGALRRWWRLVLLPVSVVALITIVSAAFAVMSAFVPPTALGPRTPADMGLDYRNVTFTTRDGVTLSAWFVTSHNGAAVVLKHGAGSTRSETLRQAAVLAHHDYGVLMVDARGHGRSGGAGMDLGWYGDPDTTAAVSFLTRQDGVTPTKIGVVGLSMGGEEAIGAAAADRRIRAVVAEGATGRTAADAEALRSDDYASTLERGLDWFTYGLTDVLTGTSPPGSLRSSVAAADQAHIFLITAGRVEREALAAASMRSAAPDRVRVWTVHRAAHTKGLSTAPAEWERRVVDFLDTQLQPRVSRP